MTDHPTVVVRGEAVREVPPEIARFAVTVSARDKSRPAALARLAERSDAVRALIDGYGDAIDRRETGQLWIRPELKRSGERVSAYAGSATTTVTVTDFGVLGELMLRLADQDQTTVAGPWWELRPGSPVHREARRAAVAEAIARAREYADALGAEVTALLQLADSGAADRPMMMTRAAFGMAANAGGGVPELDLDPQLQTVQATVEARFVITPPRLDGPPAEPS
ncbi:SIMPL domain-containing protein [Plantactinospora sp. S1510]|uniref:SIMPL domain-containing protein n=1 Tax=Plantactinospora alkalitolerans TaxID=2789879 RepID=A0ABS0H6Y4_9ACTN|nr:SIMPL domain-containing protein [Plantactinospora alkalitolerans]MBF9133914.1 SIMPL domain-containing protein [Plantactinospora alkalitolerans]